MSEVINRVNRNAAGMDFLLRAGGVTATGEYMPGTDRKTFQFNGTLLYRRPRSLYLKLEHVGGTIEAGSNPEEFWFWEKFQTPRYSWGRHEGMGVDLDADIPLRPDLLAEVLGLGDLPANTRGPGGPALWVGPGTYELVFEDYDPTGQAYLTKTIDVDRYEPFLVRSLVYFRRDGQPLMQAKLGDYRPIEGSGVLAPRLIRIDWLPDRGWVELTFATMQRFDNPAAQRRFRSPLQQGMDVGEIRRLDRPRPPARAPSTLPASGPASRPSTRMVTCPMTQPASRPVKPAEQ